MPTEIKIHGQRPTGVAWLKRCQKDKLDPATAIAALEHTAHYKVRVWAFPTHATPEVVADATSKTGVKTVFTPSYITYRLQRDGRIEKSWTNIRENQITLEHT